MWLYECMGKVILKDPNIVQFCPKKRLTYYYNIAIIICMYSLVQYIGVLHEI